MKKKKNKDSRELTKIKQIYEDGILETKNGIFSKCYALASFSYHLLDEEEKEVVLERYIHLLNAIQLPFELVFVRGKKETWRRFCKEESYAAICAYYENTVLKESEANHYRTQVYLNVVSKEKNLEDARRELYVKEMQLEGLFQGLSGIRPIKELERVKLFSDCFNYPYQGTYEEIKAEREDGSLDILAPEIAKFSKASFQINGAVGMAFYLVDYPKTIQETALLELTFEEVPLFIKVHFAPMTKGSATSYLRGKYLGVEGDILRQQRIRNRNGDFSSDISYSKKMEKESIENSLKAVTTGDETLYLVTVSGLLLQEAKEELEKTQKKLFEAGRGQGLLFQPFYYQQEEGIDFALPTGLTHKAYVRPMFSSSIRMFHPFYMKELQSVSGDFMGSNLVTREPIFVDRRQLLNGNGFLFGSSGSGKSFAGKHMILNTLLYSTDDIFVIDPMNEYQGMVKSFGGSNAFFGYDSETWMNPLDVPLGETPISQGVLKQKTELIFAMLEGAMKEPLTLTQKSILDRAMRQLLEGRVVRSEEEQVTLPAFYQILKAQPEEEAGKLCVAIEIYIYGSLNLFSHHTNIQMGNRFVGFHIADLKPELKAVAVLIMLDHLENRILENSKQGKTTWIFVDEFHELLRMESAKLFFCNTWKKVRKLGGIMTAITQNIVDVLKEEELKTMINNSEFLMFLKLNRNDLLDLTKVVKLSELEKSYLMAARAGAGILKAGDTVLPFALNIRKDNAFYKLFNTNIYDK